MHRRDHRRPSFRDRPQSDTPSYRWRINEAPSRGRGRGRGRGRVARNYGGTTYRRDPYEVQSSAQQSFSSADPPARDNGSSRRMNEGYGTGRGRGYGYTQYGSGSYSRDRYRDGSSSEPLRRSPSNERHQPTDDRSRGYYNNAYDNSYNNLYNNPTRHQQGQYQDPRCDVGVARDQSWDDPYSRKPLRRDPYGPESYMRDSRSRNSYGYGGNVQSYDQGSYQGSYRSDPYKPKPEDNARNWYEQSRESYDNAWARLVAPPPSGKKQAWSPNPFGNAPRSVSPRGDRRDVWDSRGGTSEKVDFHDRRAFDDDYVPPKRQHPREHVRGETAAKLAYNYEAGRVYGTGEDGQEYDDGPTQEEVILGVDPSFGDRETTVERAVKAGEDEACVRAVADVRINATESLDTAEVVETAISDVSNRLRLKSLATSILAQMEDSTNQKLLEAGDCTDREEFSQEEEMERNEKEESFDTNDSSPGSSEQWEGAGRNESIGDFQVPVQDRRLDEWKTFRSLQRGGGSNSEPISAATVKDMCIANDNAATANQATANGRAAVLSNASPNDAHPSSDVAVSITDSFAMPTSPQKSAPGSPNVPNGTPLHRTRTRDDDSIDSAQFPELQDERLGQGLSPEVLDAVVKIYATHCDPNYSLPWQMRRQTQSTSSGFVISGKRILTNAHSVEHYTVVRVKKRAGDHKYIARVLATGNECDLALLTVEDESFWKGLNPLSFGALPELQTSVIVVGYPIGGENISVTAGVVSRVEIQEYTHGASQLLGIQIDAAINSGSSGGPALNHRNEVVGIAFQSLNTGDSENIGYLVAESVVDHFLRDYVKNGRYTGFCHCGFAWQKMENSAMRRYMHMKPDESGILVRKVMKTSPAQQVLKQGDIVTAIDDTPISNAGTVPYRSGERISFHYIITTKFTGDDISLDILREGQKQTITYELRDSSENLLVPVHEHRRQPEYFTIAGLVFVALSEPYLAAEYGDKWDLKAPVRLLERLLYGSKEYIDEQVVLLSQVLNAEINIEYECVINTRVHKFNGEKLRNLAHLANLVDTCTIDFLRFDLDDEIVVVGREEALKASAEILETHCIPSACSIGEVPPISEEGNVARKTLSDTDGTTTAETKSEEKSAQIRASQDQAPTDKETVIDEDSITGAEASKQDELAAEKRFIKEDESDLVPQTEPKRSAAEIIVPTS